MNDDLHLYVVMTAIYGFLFLLSTLPDATESLSWPIFTDMWCAQLSQTAGCCNWFYFTLILCVCVCIPFMSSFWIVLGDISLEVTYLTKLHLKKDKKQTKKKPIWLCIGLPIKFGKWNLIECILVNKKLLKIYKKLKTL